MHLYFICGMALNYARPFAIWLGVAPRESRGSFTQFSNAWMFESRFRVIAGPLALARFADGIAQQELNTLPRTQHRSANTEAPRVLPSLQSLLIFSPEKDSWSAARKFRNQLAFQTARLF
jgi:hypothetical protein